MMGFANTNISKEDAETILIALAKVYGNIPSEIKQFIPPFEKILENIPDEARKYTVEDIIKLLQWAKDNGIIF